MNASFRSSAAAVMVFFMVGCASTADRESPSEAPAPAGTGMPELAGTSWQLVQFEGGDDQVLRPDDPSKYTVRFNEDGTVALRLDCNRGRGTWQVVGAQLELGALALTRAFCPPPSLHDQIAKQWPFVRSYVSKDGHLFLALMADGGIYEFEPVEE